MCIMVETMPQPRQATRSSSNLRPPADPLELAELRLSSGYLLARLGAESRSLWARMLAARRLTPHQFGMLMALAQVGESHQRRLSEIVGIDPRNAVAVIDALHQRRLLERSGDPDDRRRHVIRIAAQGRSTIDELRGAGEVIEHEMLAGLDPGEQAQLHALLLKLFDWRTSP